MCKPFDNSPFVGRQGLSSFVVWRVVGRENLFSRCLCRLTYAKLVPMSAMKTCFLIAECRLTYAKLVPVSAMKICFSDCRTPPNLCKSTQIMIETAILRTLFISCYHFYAYLCTKVLISEYKEKICL